MVDQEEAPAAVPGSGGAAAAADASSTPSASSIPLAMAREEEAPIASSSTKNNVDPFAATCWRIERAPARPRPPLDSSDDHHPDNSADIGMPLEGDDVAFDASGFAGGELSLGGT